MSSLAQAAAALGIKPGDPMFGQASQLWEMMDDMAGKDPEAYQQFIKKQMEEKAKMDKAQAPPTPLFAVRSKGDDGRIIWINFSQSVRVKPPKTEGDAVPIVVLAPVCAPRRPPSVPLLTPHPAARCRRAQRRRRRAVRGECTVRGSGATHP